MKKELCFCNVKWLKTQDASWVLDSKPVCGLVCYVKALQEKRCNAQMERNARNRAREKVNVQRA